MEKRTSAAARLVAAIALLVAALIVIVLIAGAMSSDDSSSGHRNGKPQAQKEKKPRTKAKTYTVESGDTLTTIARKTGVPIAELQALNPEVDPQILTVGETLQLR
ncbi:MAG TPA: LysM domain-containing protein [Solirubrobacterales bacterium]|nr:LysM domain-containing protein [Solirubrobacterales bacterium]